MKIYENSEPTFSQENRPTHFDKNLNNHHTIILLKNTKLTENTLNFPYNTAKPYLRPKTETFIEHIDLVYYF